MHGVRGASVIILSLLTLAATGLGVYEAIHSSLFLVQVVEVETEADPDAATAQLVPTVEEPVDAQTISRLAAVPIGKVNLFSLDLSQVEALILSNEWVRAVRLEKRFPQTLSISVSFRKPLALVQNGDGTLAYVDQDAKPFGKVNLSYQPDLPILMWPRRGRSPGAETGSAPELTDALEMLNRWEMGAVGRLAQISSLGWDAERGYHALVVYPLRERQPGSRSPLISRTMVDFGHHSQGSDGAQMARLAEVFRYLHDNSVSARQVWADAGKKIVVKTARGS